MNAIHRFVSAAMLGIVALAAVPAAALAAPSTDMWSAGMATMADLELKKEPTYSVTLQLKKKVKLPATVTIPVPKGCKPVWVGEVFFGDAKNDIVAEGAKVTTEGDTTYVTFTMRRARAAKVECSIAPDMMSGSLAERGINMYWTPPSLDSTAQAAVFTPQGFAAQQNPQGVTVLKTQEGGLYVVTEENPKKGQTLRIEFVLAEGDVVPQDQDAKPGTSGAATSTAATSTAGTAAAPPVAAPSQPAPVQSPDSTMTVVLGLAGLGLIVAVVALVLVLRKERAS